MWKGPRLPGGKAGWILAATAALIALILLYGSGMAPKTLETDLEKRLARVLSTVDGAGEVRVLVYTEAAGSAYAWSAQTEGVIGAIVVARGGGDAAVACRLALAAATALGIDQTRIEVFAMKGEDEP